MTCSGGGMQQCDDDGPFSLLDTLCGDKKLNARSEYLVSKTNDIKLKNYLNFSVVASSLLSLW